MAAAPRPKGKRSSSAPGRGYITRASRKGAPCSKTCDSSFAAGKTGAEKARWTPWCWKISSANPPAHAPWIRFAYLAFALHQEGATGSSLLNHRDWSLFLFSPPVVERLFLEADRNGLLRFQAAGKIVRIDFPAHSFEEMADVVAARAH